MQPNPKKVRRNEDKDYAEIYQDNFIAQNDPAPLGQAAFNRQLTAGVRKRIGQGRLETSGGQTFVGRTSATQRAGYSPVDNAQMVMDRRAGAMARAQQPQAGLVGDAVPPSLDTMGQNFVGSTSATQRAGYSPVDVSGETLQRRANAELRAAQGEAGLTDNAMPSLSDMSGDPNIDRRLGLEAQRDARAQQIRLGEPSATALSGYSQSGDIRRDQIQSDIYARQDELRRGQMARLDEIAGLNRQKDAREREIEYNLLNANQKAGFGVSGDIIRQREQERVAGLEAQRQGRIDELIAAQEQEAADAEARAAETQRVFEERRGAAEGLEIQREAEEAAARERALADIEPYDGGGGPTDTDGNQITLSGATASYDNGITQEEQRLNEQLDAEENAVLQSFNEKYNQFLQIALNRGAVRGDLESQGFTGGIGQQIRDYLSTQEMAALNAIMVERDQALQAIDLERNNIPNIAKTNYIQSLQLESATMEAQTAFSQMISQKVLDGSMSLAEANGLAQEYGLQDVQSVFESAIEAQIAAGTMDKNTAMAELERLGLDTSFLEKVGKTQFTDFATSDEAADLERQINSLLTQAGEADWMDIGGGILAGAASGAVAGAILPVGGPIIGAIVGGIIGGISGAGADLNKQDLGTLTNGLFNSELILQEGSNIMTGQIDNISIDKPAGQGTSFGELGLQFQVSVNGKQYQMEGADLVILAAALKKKGISQSDSRYKAIFTTAESIHRNSGDVTFGSTLDYLGGQKYSTVYKFYNQAMGRSTALFGADIGTSDLF